MPSHTAGRRAVRFPAIFEKLNVRKIQISVSSSSIPLSIFQIKCQQAHSTYNDKSSLINVKSNKLKLTLPIINLYPQITPLSKFLR